ncbi:MAG: carboxymuconolactone decarboxylase family protein [Promethearchaeota archaeon]
MKSSEEIYKEATSAFKEFQEFNPSAMNGFLKYVHSSNKDGALSAKIKQIILVSVAITKRCEWCIVYHTRKALELGASREELMEACLVTSVMDGGPTMMHSQLVFQTIDEYQREQELLIQTIEEN